MHFVKMAAPSIGCDDNFNYLPFCLQNNHFFCQVSKQRNEWMREFLNVGSADLWVQKWDFVIPIPKHPPEYSVEAKY